MDRRRTGSRARAAWWAANHSSHLDAPLVMSGVPHYISLRPGHGVAADLRLSRRGTRSSSPEPRSAAFPVDRRGRVPIEVCPKLLAAGMPLLISPRAPAGETGKMAPFQIGAWLALCRPGARYRGLVGAHGPCPGSQLGRAAVVRPWWWAVGAPLRAEGDENAIGFNEQDRSRRAGAVRREPAPHPGLTARAGPTPNLRTRPLRGVPTRRLGIPVEEQAGSSPVAWLRCSDPRPGTASSPGFPAACRTCARHRRHLDDLVRHVPRRDLLRGWRANKSAAPDPP
ncbi:hypothetical protein QJS66_09380 [Kocuria rhizophila]|nr:hypothetical protein QJS66_09380 [Kocuria rhizophila]